jgi:hypothetical protein
MSEVFAATDYDPEKFKPMDPRRIKRMCDLFERTGWTDAETGNRLAAAIICSRSFRKDARKSGSSDGS